MPGKAARFGRASLQLRAASAVWLWPQPVPVMLVRGGDVLAPGAAIGGSPNPEDTTMTKTLTKSDLAEFTGTEQIYRHGLVRHIVYTDGVQHVAEAGEAYWLIDKIACAQLEPHIRAQEFQLWKLSVNDDLSADLTCTDGNGTTISEERISYTDFPLPEIKFYVANRTILLASEY